MRVIVIVPDQIISIDGVHRKIAFEGPTGAHAIQWDSESLHGQIEGGQWNGPFKDPSIVEKYITLWHDASHAHMLDIGRAHAKSIEDYKDHVKSEDERRAAYEREWAAMEAKKKAEFEEAKARAARGEPHPAQ